MFLSNLPPNADWLDLGLNDYDTCEHGKDGLCISCEVEQASEARIQAKTAFLEHDCHSSPEDGCTACEEWMKYLEADAAQKLDQDLNRLIEKKGKLQWQDLWGVNPSNL